MDTVRHIEKITLATDEQLLLAYQQKGDQEHLAVLFLRYSDLVYGTALKYLKDADQAKDAVMNIYYDLVNKLRTHEVDHFKSWLYVVTKNHCLMWLRKHKSGMTVEFQPAFMQSADDVHLDDLLAKEQQFKQLENCITALQEEQQKAIRLFYLEGKCYNEIKEITGLDWDRVRSLIQNGRRNLKNCMNKHA